MFILSILPFSTILAEDAPSEESREEPTRTIQLALRDGTETVWSGAVTLPDSNTATTTATATDGTRSDIPAASALAALIIADTLTDTFSITQLEYFSSYGSFYTKCITATTERCDSWQYVVGETYPSVGMDQFLLPDGETLFVYFGSPRRTSLNTSTIAAGGSIIATAERYLPASDTYAPIAGVTLGLTQSNPDDPYSPLIIATSSSDANGAATFTPAAIGSYSVGIAEDYFYPSVTLEVIAAEASTDEESDSPPQVPASSGGGSSHAHQQVDVAAATRFLMAYQRPDGSFETPLITDWSALAFAATPEAESGERLLRAYLTDTSGGLSSATDYERRAMALMALDIDPSTGTSVDYIAKIRAAFDGTQFGDSSLVNDDIFALIVLMKAGYGAEDMEIMNTHAFVLDAQREDGSWDGSVDLTAAAIQALMPLRSSRDVADTLHKAHGYLRTNQKGDGGFGNSFSTSWAMQAIAALGEDHSAWQSSGKNPAEYLASLQSIDGGIEATSDIRTRLWATAYAIPAALGKDWPSIMSSFEKNTTSGVSITEPVSTIASTSLVTLAATEQAIALPSALTELPLTTNHGPSTLYVAAETDYSPRATSTSAAPAPTTLRHVAAAAVVEELTENSVFTRLVQWFMRIGATIRSLF